MDLEDLIEPIIAFFLWIILGISIVNPALLNADFPSPYEWLKAFLLGNYWIDVPLIELYRMWKRYSKSK